MLSRKRAFIPTLVGLLILVALAWAVPALEASPTAGSSGVESVPQIPGAVTAGTYSDSGWQLVAKGTCKTFNHNLGGNPDDYVVDLWFLDTLSFGTGIHRYGYGGLDLVGKEEGAHWEKLATNTIDVCRGADDPKAQLVRVQVWISASTPDYASPWTTIGPRQTIAFPHNLNVPRGELVVSLWFKDTGANSIGIHNFGYGGLAINATQEMRGAYWHSLTKDEVMVTRYPDDRDVAQVRVVVVRADPPDYDSAWQALAVGYNPFNHNLKWNPEMLMVRAECRDPALGIHQQFAGGNQDWLIGEQGVHLRGLTRESIVAWRWADDQVCPEARIRIWKRKVSAYAPLVLRKY